VTIETGFAASSTAAINILKRSSQTIAVNNLDLKSVEGLLGSVFGVASHLSV